MRRIAIVTLMSLLPAVAFAEAAPPSNKHDPRVREATYVDGQVFRVYASVLHSTTLEFPPGEVFVDMATGDSEGWEYGSAAGGRAITMKPLLRGIRTNVTIFTNRRAYYLNAIETPNATYFAVRFNGGYTVKETALPDSKKVQPTGPWKHYGANVRNVITPTNVWDDGVYTYFEFYPTSPIPAIFKTLTGDEITVNSTVLENKIVRVSGISRYWILRSGEMETVIKRLQPSPPVQKKIEVSHDR